MKTMNTGEDQVLFSTYARFPLVMVKGEGSRLWDDGGNEYIDFTAGIAVTALGHNHPHVRKRVQEQLDKLWHVSNLFHHPNQTELARMLTRISGADRVFFCNSGAEANEGAIKLARRYMRKVLQEDRYEIITFAQSFHGRTLATLTATGQDKVKDGFAPLPSGFVHVPFNNLNALEAAITKHTCAIMLEFVQGEGGVNVADPVFVQGIKALCERHNLLLIADEIQTGLGRTGKWFACQHYGVDPDIITLAKGLGNGLPIGAVLGKEKLAEAFTPGSHGTTFGGNPVTTAAAIAVLETMEREQLPERAAGIGERMIRTLGERLQAIPSVQAVRGLGLMIGIPCEQPVELIIRAAREQGLLVLNAGPNVIRLLPALTIPEADVEQGLNILCDAIVRHFETAV